MIKEQVRDTEKLIDQEGTQYEVDHPANSRLEAPMPTQEEDQRSEETLGQAPKKDGKGTNIQDSDVAKPDVANSDDVTTPGALPKPPERDEAPKDTGDDGGEVVEGEEDTVIY